MRGLLVFCVCFQISLGGYSAGSAPIQNAEYVTVVKVLQDGDKAIIRRQNGQLWMIEKGAGAISLWRYEGKPVLIHSPGLFCGVGSKLLLPEISQEARIWNAEQLGDMPLSGGGTFVPDADGVAETARAIGQALHALKYYEPTSDDLTKRDIMRALEKFQKANNVDTVGNIGSKTLAKLAEQILRQQGDQPEALMLSLTLVRSALQMQGTLSQNVPTGRSAGSTSETFITSVSRSGAVVQLADGSVYEVDALGQIKSMLWLPSQKVLHLPSGLCNLTTGHAVSAKRLK